MKGEVAEERRWKEGKVKLVVVFCWVEKKRLFKGKTGGKEQLLPGRNQLGGVSRDRMVRGDGLR